MAPKVGARPSDMTLSIRRSGDERQAERRRVPSFSALPSFRPRMALCVSGCRRMCRLKPPCGRDGLRRRSRPGNGCVTAPASMVSSHPSHRNDGTKHCHSNSRVRLRPPVPGVQPTPGHACSNPSRGTDGAWIVDLRQVSGCCVRPACRAINPCSTLPGCADDLTVRGHNVDSIDAARSLLARDRRNRAGLASPVPKPQRPAGHREPDSP